MQPSLERELNAKLLRLQSSFQRFHGKKVSQLRSKELLEQFFLFDNYFLNGQELFLTKM